MSGASVFVLSLFFVFVSSSFFLETIFFPLYEDGNSRQGVGLCVSTEPTLPVLFLFVKRCELTCFWIFALFVSCLLGCAALSFLLLILFPLVPTFFLFFTTYCGDESTYNEEGSFGSVDRGVLKGNCGGRLPLVVPSLFGWGYAPMSLERGDIPKNKTT